MKKVILFIVICAMTFTLAVCSTNDNSNDVIKSISKMLNIEISDAELMNNTETHGGFHGDGTTFVSMEITDNTTIEEIKSEWNELPLTENLTALVYGIKEDISSIGPYLTENGETLFPQIENGYYYFNDKQNEGKDRFDDADVLNRPSFNFIIAIYDTDNNTLHYCKFDT